MALFVLILFVIPVVLGVLGLVVFVSRIFWRSTPGEDFAAHRQSAHHLLEELESLKAAEQISEAEYEDRRKRIVGEFVSRTQNPSL